jgi:hypothetical protein
VGIDLVLLLPSSVCMRLSLWDLLGVHIIVLVRHSVFLFNACFVRMKINKSLILSLQMNRIAKTMQSTCFSKTEEKMQNVCDDLTTNEQFQIFIFLEKLLQNDV